MYTSGVRGYKDRWSSTVGSIKRILAGGRERKRMREKAVGCGRGSGSALKKKKG